MGYSRTDLSTFRSVLSSHRLHAYPDTEALCNGLPSGQPGLILCRLTEKGEGYDFSRTIRQHPELSSVPVILISEGNTPVDFIRTVESGANELTERSVSAEHLRTLTDKYYACTVNRGSHVIRPRDNPIMR